MIHEHILLYLLRHNQISDFRQNYWPGTYCAEILFIRIQKVCFISDSF